MIEREIWIGGSNDLLTSEYVLLIKRRRKKMDGSVDGSYRFLRSQIPAQEI